MQIVLFRELTVMSTSILQGKVARLPLVYALRGTAKSHAASHQSNPLFFALRDAGEFFRHYTMFRDGIAGFIRRTKIDAPDGASLEQLLDMVFATYLGREVDVGMFNYAAQTLLGENLPPIQPAAATLGWQEPAEGDIVHTAPSRTWRYIWRKRLIEAEPREEIAISPLEMERVERQLEVYK
jgi:hypothetical protein